MIFGDRAAYIDYDVDTPALKLAEEFMTHNGGTGKVHVGHGTDFPSIFTAANKKYDRIIIFRDNFKAFYIYQTIFTVSKYSNYTMF